MQPRATAALTSKSPLIPLLSKITLCERNGRNLVDSSDSSLRTKCSFSPWRLCHNVSISDCHPERTRGILDRFLPLVETRISRCARNDRRREYNVSVLRHGLRREKLRFDQIFSLLPRVGTWDS